MLFVKTRCELSKIRSTEILFIDVFVHDVQQPTFKNRAYFKVNMSLVLSDVNVRGDNVIKPSLGQSVLIRS